MNNYGLLTQLVILSTMVSSHDMAKSSVIHTFKGRGCQPRPIHGGCPLFLAIVSRVLALDCRLLVKLVGEYRHARNQHPLQYAPNLHAREEKAAHNAQQQQYPGNQPVGEIGCFLEEHANHIEYRYQNIRFIDNIIHQRSFQASIPPLFLSPKKGASLLYIFSKRLIMFDFVKTLYPARIESYFG